MPATVLDTFGIATADAVADAIRNGGYRHIDTSAFNRNEGVVGAGIAAAIRSGAVTRAELFVSTKLWGYYHDGAEAAATLQASLAALGLDYLDAAFVHFPAGGLLGIASAKATAAANAAAKASGVPPPTKTLSPQVQAVVRQAAERGTAGVVPAWRALEAAHAAGRVRRLGLSNFSPEQVRLVRSVAVVQPFVSQMEFLPGEDAAACAADTTTTTTTASAASAAARSSNNNSDDVGSGSLAAAVAVSSPAPLAGEAVVLGRGRVAGPADASRRVVLRWLHSADLRAAFAKL